MRKHKDAFLPEKFKLVPLSQRHPMFYIEHAMIARRDQGICVLAKGAIDTTLPVSALGGIILGPGTSITHEAMKICMTRGCYVAISGGGGVPLWSLYVDYRDPRNKLRQFGICTGSQRVEVAKRMLAERQARIQKHGLEYEFPVLEVPAEADTIEKILLHEARWSKSVFAKLYKDFRMPVSGKVRDKVPVTLFNHFLYSVASLVINHLGYEPNLGIMHGHTRGGGLVFDLADVYKPVLCYPQSFHAQSVGMSAGQMKAVFIADIHRMSIIDDMIDLLGEVFDDSRA